MKKSSTSRQNFLITLFLALDAGLFIASWKTMFSGREFFTALDLQHYHTFQVLFH